MAPFLRIVKSGKKIRKPVAPAVAMRRSLAYAIWPGVAMLGFCYFWSLVCYSALRASDYDDEAEQPSITGPSDRA